MRLGPRPSTARCGQGRTVALMPTGWRGHYRPCGCFNVAWAEPSRGGFRIDSAAGGWRGGDDVALACRCPREYQRLTTRSGGFVSSLLYPPAGREAGCGDILVNACPESGVGCRDWGCESRVEVSTRLRGRGVDGVFGRTARLVARLNTPLLGARFGTDRGGYPDSSRRAVDAGSTSWRGSRAAGRYQRSIIAITGNASAQLASHESASAERNSRPACCSAGLRSLALGKERAETGCCSRIVVGRRRE